MADRWGTQRTATPGWRKLRRAIIARDRTCQIRYQNICTGEPDTVDHITPAYRDGSDDEDNLQAACWPCHRRKTGIEAAAAKPQRRRPPPQHPGLL